MRRFKEPRGLDAFTVRRALGIAWRFFFDEAVARLPGWRRSLRVLPYRWRQGLQGRSVEWTAAGGQAVSVASAHLPEDEKRQDRGRRPGSVLASARVPLSLRCCITPLHNSFELRAFIVS